MTQAEPPESSSECQSEDLPLTPSDRSTDVPPGEMTFVVNLNNAEAWYNRAGSLYKLGRLEEAIASFDRAISIEPHYFEAWNNRGVTLKRLRRLEEAIASFDGAIALKADYHQAWNNRGNALFELRRYEEAVISYNRAIAIKADDYLLWYNRGEALGNLGRYEEAIASYDRALVIKPDLREAKRLRRIALDRLSDIQAEISSDRQRFQAEDWFSQGKALFQLGQYEEALAHFDRAIASKPDDYQAWNDRGWALFHTQGYSAALQNWQEALQRLPSNAPDYRQACGELYYSRGRAYAWQGNLQEAKNSYRSAVDFLTVENFRDRHLEVLNDLIRVCQDLGEDVSSSRYTEIQQILAPQAAAIYWHVSLVAITTVILRYNKSPLILEHDPRQNFWQRLLGRIGAWMRRWFKKAPPITRQRRELAEWMARRKGGAEGAELAKLSDILDINNILQQVGGVEQLILIRPQDWQGVPIAALFPQRFAIAYLPRD